MSVGLHSVLYGNVQHVLFASGDSNVTRLFAAEPATIDDFAAAHNHTPL